MRKVLTLAFVCLLATATLAKQVETAEAPPPMPLTRQQLLAAQYETFRNLEMLSYVKSYEWQTLDEGGNVTGSMAGAWRVLRLKEGPYVEKIADVDWVFCHRLLTDTGYATPNTGLCGFRSRCQWIPRSI